MTPTKITMAPPPFTLATLSIQSQYQLDRLLVSFPSWWMTDFVEERDSVMIYNYPTRARKSIAGQPQVLPAPEYRQHFRTIHRTCIEMVSLFRFRNKRMIANASEQVETKPKCMWLLLCQNEYRDYSSIFPLRELAVGVVSVAQNSSYHHRSFQLFPKLPIEIRRLIWRFYLLDSPSTVELGIDYTPRGPRFASTQFATTSQISKAIQQGGLSAFGLITLKKDRGNKAGVYYHPEIDMLYLSQPYNTFETEFYFPWELTRALFREKALANVRCIAIQQEHEFFISLIQNFGKYCNLELVFVVTGYDMFMEKEVWGSDPADLNFELLLPYMELSHGDLGGVIPGFSQVREIQDLMVRDGPDGKKVAPHVHFVRVIKKC